MATHHEGKKILLSGGGSGGHITPLLALAEELKNLDPKANIVSIGERGGKFAHLTDDSPNISSTRTIFAGKFRRYHGESALRRLVDVRTNLLNIRDALYVVLGLVQSIYFVKREKPDVVFLKGGFVGVPVGFAAALWRVPIVTHDSDAMPGLANRIISRWARLHATGMPATFYPYDPTKVVHVGVIVGSQYQKVDENTQSAYRSELGLPETGKVLFITGGSLGSQRINRAVIEILPTLLDSVKDLTVIHQVGKGNIGQYQGYTHERLRVLEFLEGMYRYSGAADVIVTRAGANTMAEFGIQTKACIVIPSPFLSGGHQLKNAEYLADHKAAAIVQEQEMMHDPEVLKNEIDKILSDEALRTKLAVSLNQLAVPDAAKKLAGLLLEIATKHG